MFVISGHLVQTDDSQELGEPEVGFPCVRLRVVGIFRI